MTDLPVRPLGIRKLYSRIATVLAFLGTAFGVFILGLIIVQVFIEGISALDLGFLFNQTKPAGREDAGIGNAILGTAFITLGAALISIPLGTLGGIYLSEYGRGTKLALAIRFSANVMMGIPSIIVGTFIFAIIILIDGTSTGVAGSFALAVIMFPLVLRTTEDMLGMVPNALREAALSTGMPRWRATLSVLFRSAKGGLITGTLLAIARVAGETAPLLFVVQFSRQWPWESYFDNRTANLTVMITQYTEIPAMRERAWGAALVIMACVLIINIVARTAFKHNK